MAVTRPIQYARHRNNTRVYLTLIATWVLSAGIALPVILGANQSPERVDELCILYNSAFIIASSMCSFYIPCVIMLILYFRIFRAIKLRSKRSQRRSQTSSTARSSGKDAHVIVNVAHCHSGSAVPHSDSAASCCETRLPNGPSDCSGTELLAASNGGTSSANGAGRFLRVSRCENGDSPATRRRRFLHLPHARGANGSSLSLASLGGQPNGSWRVRGRPRSASHKQTQSTKRERKATKTLAIVLG